MPLQDITIYHLNNSTHKWVGYNLEASFRNTSIRNRNKVGVADADKALIRVFDVTGYNTTWFCDKGDVIVNKSVTTVIDDAPMTELKEAHGKDNVYQVQSIDIFDFNDELSHIKIGAK